jgi:hypothetical protein
VCCEGTDATDLYCAPQCVETIVFDRNKYGNDPSWDEVRLSICVLNVITDQAPDLRKHVQR